MREAFIKLDRLGNHRYPWYNTNQLLDRDAASLAVALNTGQVLRARPASVRMLPFCSSVASRVLRSRRVWTDVRNDDPAGSFFRPDHEYSLPHHPSPVRVI